MHRLLCCLLLLLSCTAVWAQPENPRTAEIRELFNQEQYAGALTLINRYWRQLRDDDEAKFLRALCHYQLNDLDVARTELHALVESDRNPYAAAWLYLGRVYHEQHQFAEAANYYKLYLQTIRPDHQHRRMVYDMIRRSANGMERQYQDPLAVVENMGPEVNSSGDEFRPVPSPGSGTRLYFSGARPGSTGGLLDKQGRPDERLGRFRADMYRTEVKAGSWQTPVSMHYTLNSPQHEVLLTFGKKGQKLYYFQGWSLDRGTIMVDTFVRNNERQLQVMPFVGPWNPNIGDGAFQLVGDTMLLFSSSRVGGLGGLDIYRTVLRDGAWSLPENLGPGVNSPYDETTPFLAKDGKTLYFSSNNSTSSIGGYDVLKTVYNEKLDRWSTPYNLGLPINSGSDDTDFVLGNSGYTGFFASSRKDGLGQRDLYVAYFQDYLPEMSEVSVPEQHEVVVPPPAETPAPAPVPPAATPPASTPPPVASPPASSWAELAWQPGVLVRLPQAFRDLNGLVAAMREHPGLQLVATAYGPEEQSESERLVTGMQAAGQLSQQLQSSGLSAKRIFARAAAYPGAASKTMIELSFAEVPAGLEPLPVIGEQYTGIAHGSFTQAPLQYRVQISSTKNPARSPKGDVLYDMMLENTSDGRGYYRYTAGLFTDFASAKAYRRQLANNGFRDAYVVVYLYGRRITNSEARQHSGIFPDLNYFLQKK